MNGKVHATGGVVFGIATAVAISKFPELQQIELTYPEFLNSTLETYDIAKTAMQTVVIVAGSWIGSLLPDIDHPTSRMSKKIGLFLIPYRILQFIFGRFKATKDYVGHRGITHTILFLLIPMLIALFVPMYGIIKIALISISIGILSHLLLDMLNPMGVPLFMPISKKKFRLLPKKLCIKTK